MHVLVAIVVLYCGWNMNVRAEGLAKLRYFAQSTLDEDTNPAGCTGVVNIWRILHVAVGYGDMISEVAYKLGGLFPNRVLNLCHGIDGLVQMLRAKFRQARAAALWVYKYKPNAVFGK